MNNTFCVPTPDLLNVTVVDVYADRATDTFATALWDDGEESTDIPGYSTPDTKVAI